MFLSFIGFYCLQFFLIYGFVYHLYCYLFYHENVFIIIFMIAFISVLKISHYSFICFVILLIVHQGPSHFSYHYYVYIFIGPNVFSR